MRSNPTEWVQGQWSGSTDPDIKVGQSTLKVGVLHPPTVTNDLTWREHNALQTILERAYTLGLQHGRSGLWSRIEKLKEQEYE